MADTPCSYQRNGAGVAPVMMQRIVGHEEKQLGSILGVTFFPCRPACSMGWYPPLSAETPLFHAQLLASPSASISITLGASGFVTTGFCSPFSGGGGILPLGHPSVRRPASSMRCLSSSLTCLLGRRLAFPSSPNRAAWTQ